MKLLFKTKKKEYYSEALLDAIIDTSMNGLLRNLDRDLKLWQYPKSVKIVGNSICGNEAKVTIKTPEGYKIIKLKASFEK